MTGISSELLYSCSGKRPSYYPRSVQQTVTCFASKDDDTKKGTDVSKMRRALRKGSGEDNSPVSVLENMQMYSQSLKKQRQTSNDTALAKKKLRYSFKKISSKIISSKTSVAARQVVSQAKREIQKLKDAKRTGKYDSDEIDAAIDHAKAMERIARKKARHLEEEEMAERCSSDKSSDKAPAIDTDEPGDKNDPVKKEIEEIRDQLGDIEEKAENEEYTESGEVTNEMLCRITDGMEEMLDAIEELNDLLGELASAPADMDPEDIDAMRVKHRNKEMKEITKADSDYLKALFDHYEKIKADGGMPFEGSGGDPVSTQAIDVAL